MFQLLKGKLQNKTKQKSLRPVNQANKQEKKTKKTNKKTPTKKSKASMPINKTREVKNKRK